MTEAVPNSQRKLFFGLFIFPLLIAVGMAILLCTVVFLTHEAETPESLIAAIKTGAPSKRWQKAFELSNELNRDPGALRGKSVMREIIHILEDPSHYDPKTRGFMAVALAHFDEPEAEEALRKRLSAQDDEQVVLYALWALGSLDAVQALGDIAPYLKSENAGLRKMAAYVAGALEGVELAPVLRVLLDDPVRDVQWNAAIALARLRDPSGRDVILKMLDAPDASEGLSEAEAEKNRINAIRALGLIRDPRADEVLNHLSKTDKSLKVRQSALEALQTTR
ncbi:MAG: HEAT repeat domain-containing protein [Candidatus Omnitrophica bacterium]|nr:HEAT repeat domain-containing protein [Candidatus Omnitrophota bacterium]